MKYLNKLQRKGFKGAESFASGDG